jgi:hypothetical protein
VSEVDAVERGGRDDVDPSGLVDGERVAHRLPEAEHPAPAGPAIHRTDHAALGHEHQLTAPGGESRDDLVVRRHRAGQVDVAAEDEAGAGGVLAHHLDVVGAGGDDGPVAVVEVEVSAAREVAEHVEPEPPVGQAV